jgi:glutaminase
MSSNLLRWGDPLPTVAANPVTGKQLVKPEDIPQILATMTMAGMTAPEAGHGESRSG